jgi:hypothetical protein
MKMLILDGVILGGAALQRCGGGIRSAWALAPEVTL